MSVIEMREPLVTDGVGGPDTGTGRRVLDGAFAILDALAGTESGLGLTELTQRSGLAKASAYRLAEQLVSLGAVQRHDRRYYVGPRLNHIGQVWQPDPRLRALAQPFVRRAAETAGAIVSMTILAGGRPRLICATAPRGHPPIPEPSGDWPGRSATGCVLHGTDPDTADAVPAGWTARDWHRLRASLQIPDATVSDRHDVLPGISCVAAPVWGPDGRCAGVITAMAESPGLPPALPGLVARTARAVGAAMR
jgi:DNA-binding IclR family transcriptional regulator